MSYSEDEQETKKEPEEEVAVQKPHMDSLSDGTKEFRTGISHGLETIFDGLRENLHQMELHSKAGNLRVMEKESMGFLEKQDKVSVEKLKARQQREYQRTLSAYKISCAANESREKAILQQISLNTAAENNDITIQEQEEAQNISAELKELLDDHRTAFEEFLRQIEKQHTKARKQLSAAQDRKIQDKKTLIELETSNMSEEKRLNRMKTFQFKINHQKSKDKKVGEHLRASQALEMKQIKERFDMEIRYLEELQMAQAKNNERIMLTEHRQREEVQKAEVEIKEMTFGVKAAMRASNNHKELALLNAKHQLELKLMYEQQDERKHNRKKRWEEKISRIQSLMGSPNAESDTPFVDVPENLGICSMAFGLSSGNDLLEKADSDESRKALGGDNVSAQDPMRLKEQLSRLEHDLKVLISSHSKQIQSLRRKCDAEYLNKEAEVKEALNVLSEEHAEQITNMEKQQRNELSAIKQTQEKESLMEENILNSEHNMLLERKRLNLMFLTVVDGIITINPKGVIQRFNTSAEGMFGYTAAEVVGQNIKMLQPEYVSINHDEYLRKYLETGIKKVIGVGRSTQGKKKDSSLFPLHLSLSEVKSEGVHIFTAVIRNLTKEHEAQAIKEKEAKKKMEMTKSMVQDLATERGRCSDLIHSMLPPLIASRMLAGETVLPETFAEATVLFTEICGFAELSTSYAAMDIVDLLNDLYCVFDEVVLGYDVYKVETIGDSYVCVSGVPKLNPNHACDITKLALHFQQAIKLVRMKNYPEFELKLKVGIHSGPLVAGIVGCKNPRYCLFGDTVNTASRMKSTAEAKTIQVSSTTHKLLESVEGSPYQMVCRGDVQVKGKGAMKTYYLDDIKGFEIDMRALEQMKIIK